MDLQREFRTDWEWKHALGFELTLPVPAHFLACLPDNLSPKASIQLVYALGNSLHPEDQKQCVLKSVCSPVTVDTLMSGVAVTGSIDEEFIKGKATLSRLKDTRLAHLEINNLWFGAATDVFLACFYISIQEPGSNQVLLPLNLVHSVSPDFQAILQTDRAGNVFVESDDCRIRIYAYRTGDKPQSIISKLVITNCWTKEKTSIPVTIDLAKTFAQKKDIILPVVGKGVYTVALIAENKELFSINVAHIANPRKTSDASPFGINLFQQQNWSYTFDLPLLAKAGIKWLRPWLAWENCWWRHQPSRDTWDWTQMDNMLHKCDELGLRYQHVFYGAPAWAYDPNTPWANNIMDNLTWIEYASTMVNKYKDRIQAWEFWNEPFARYTPEQYLPLVKALRTGVRSADPNAFCISIVGSAMDYVETFGALGGLNYSDAISSHIYFFWPVQGSPVNIPENDLQQELWEQRAVQLRYGHPDQSIWFNELGYGANDLDPNYSRKIAATEIEQAQLLVRMYLIALSVRYVDKVMWFCSIDPRDSRDVSIGDSQIGILRMDRSPKLSYAAFSALCQQMHVPRIIGRLDIPEPGWAYAWDVDGKVVITAWASAGTNRFQLPAKFSEKIRIIDMMGNPVSIPATGDQIDLELHGTPVYIHGVPADEVKKRLIPYQVRFTNAKQLRPGELEPYNLKSGTGIDLTPGETTRFSIGVTEVTKPGRIRFEFSQQEELKIVPSKAELDLRTGKDSMFDIYVSSTKEQVIKPEFSRQKNGDIKISFATYPPIFTDGFEGIDGRLPKGWIPFSGNDTPQKESDDYIWDSGGHKSSRSLKVNRHAGDWCGFRSSAIPVKPNSKYMLSFMGKYEGNGTHGVRAYVMDANDNAGYIQSVLETNHSEWRKKTCVFMTRRDTKQIYIKLELHGDDQDGSGWFDDVSLVEL